MSLLLPLFIIRWLLVIKNIDTGYMSFVFPGFLFALLAVSIPIAIHLFHFRRFRKIFFSNVSFLEQLSDESKKQSRLKHLIVLAARIMAIVMMVFAFARPYIPVADTMISLEGNSVAVYIDNSFSMEALSGQGRLLDAAKQKAAQLAAAYHSTDRFLLLTNDFEGRHQRFVSNEEFLSFLAEVDVSPSVKTTSEVAQRIRALMKDERYISKRSYLIGDFQKSVTDLADVEADTTMITTLIPVYAQFANNVFVDSCWFETPVTVTGQNATLIIRIRNDGDRSLENQPVRLYIDGVQRAIATYDLAPQDNIEVSLNWAVQQPGVHHGYVEIIDYPVTFDDRLYFSFRVREEIPVLAISESGSNVFLHALFRSNNVFNYQNIPAFSIDYSRFPLYDLIILDGLRSISPGLAFELQGFVEKGGALLVFPGNQIDLEDYREFSTVMGLDIYSRLDTTRMRVSGLNELHEVYTDVFESIPENMDVPVANQYYVMSRTVRSESETLMSLQNGQTFLSSQRHNQGKVFLAAVGLSDEFSNFHRHALFVPTIANIALQSQPYQPLYHVLGRNYPILVTGQALGSDEVFSLRRQDVEIIPEQRRVGNQAQLMVHDQIDTAGSYDLYTGVSNLIKGISFNYDRRESLLKAYSSDELATIITDIGMPNTQILDSDGADFKQILQGFRMGRQLWQWCIVLALLFLALEVVLLRFWK
jgi:hypothetical protein